VKEIKDKLGVKIDNYV